MSDQQLTAKEPDYATKVIEGLKDQRRIAVEQTNLTAVQVLQKVVDWTASVAEGKTQVIEYTMKGDPIEVDGRKYLFDHADKLKSLGAGMESFGGRQETKSVAFLTFHWRTKAAPRKLSASEAREVTVLEIEEE